MPDGTHGAGSDGDLSGIVECLERQTQVLRDDHEALLLLIRQTSSFGVELRGVSETLKTIAHRQAELEVTSERRRVTCAEIMHNLSDRIAALEYDKTPVPRPLTPKEVSDLCPRGLTGLSAEPGNGNGCGEIGLSLMIAGNDKDEDS
jgi:hypothetical protein